MPNDTIINCPICGKSVSLRGMVGHKRSRQCLDIANREESKNNTIEVENMAKEKEDQEQIEKDRLAAEKDKADKEAEQNKLDHEKAEKDKLDAEQKDLEAKKVESEKKQEPDLNQPEKSFLGKVWDSLGSAGSDDF